MEYYFKMPLFPRAPFSGFDQRSDEEKNWQCFSNVEFSPAPSKVLNEEKSNTGQSAGPIRKIKENKYRLEIEFEYQQPRPVAATKIRAVDPATKIKALPKV